ncbi:MAG: hypothetical protein IPJ30_26400 [Acidobacteria bacterium]|nr:hypothetical protein [Acidobacteriota bacterium]
MDTITVFQFRADGRSALVFRSLVSGATGISVRYLQWMVLSGKQMQGFESLSSNPQMIFWDKEEQINFYSIIESEPQAEIPEALLGYYTSRFLSFQGKSEVIRAERKSITNLLDLKI